MIFLKIKKQSEGQRLNRLLVLPLLGLTLGIIPLLTSAATLEPQARGGSCNRFGLAPDNNLSMLITHIKSAKKSIKVNIYEFRNDAVKDALIERIQSGVSVKILVEGQPVGGVMANELQVLKDLRTAMNAAGNSENAIYVMTNPSNKGKSSDRRYNFDHAKYVVVDTKRVLVASENFSNSGHAPDGGVGNRGWEIIVCDPKAVKALDAMFDQDADDQQDDIIKVTPKQTIPVTLAAKSANEPKFKARKQAAIAVGSGAVGSAEVISSPNSTEGLVKMLQDATTSVEVEHMTLPYLWKDDNKKEINSPVVDEMVKAARRGLKVRILMNDPGSFGSSGSNNPVPGSGEPTDPGEEPRSVPANLQTLSYINQIATSENLDLEARIIGTKKVEITYVHNKGMITDRNKVLVSSINGTRNSMENNREVALLVSSEDAGSYYGDVFDLDWGLSEPKTKDLPPQVGPFMTELVSVFQGIVH